MSSFSGVALNFLRYSANKSAYDRYFSRFIREVSLLTNNASFRRAAENTIFRLFGEDISRDLRDSELLRRVVGKKLNEGAFDPAVALLGDDAHNLISGKEYDKGALSARVAQVRRIYESGLEAHKPWRDVEHDLSEALLTAFESYESDSEPHVDRSRPAEHQHFSAGLTFFVTIKDLIEKAYLSSRKFVEVIDDAGVAAQAHLVDGTGSPMHAQNAIG